MGVTEGSKRMGDSDGGLPPPLSHSRLLARCRFPSPSLPSVPVPGEASLLSASCVNLASLGYQCYVPWEGRGDMAAWTVCMGELRVVQMGVVREMDGRKGVERE